MTTYHTAAELRHLSNVGHVVEGLLLAGVAMLALAQAFGHLQTGRARYLWPALLLAAGLFLPALIFTHPTLAIMRAHLSVIVGDPQQRQHLFMAAVLLCSGIAEVVAIHRDKPALRMVWPIALVAIGVLFLLHPQHGTGDAVRLATTIHQWVGSISIASGIIRAIDLRFAARARWSRVTWPILLLVAAILLAIYREPPGAYEPPIAAPTHTMR